MNVKWDIIYYQDSQGNIPVQDFIRQQYPKVKAKIIRYVDLLQDLNLTLGEQYVEKLAGSDVWELKMRHGSDCYRILYFASSGRTFILLHAFLKKTNKTPKSEITVATNRMIDYILRYTP